MRCSVVCIEKKIECVSLNFFWLNLMNLNSYLTNHHFYTPWALLVMGLTVRGEEMRQNATYNSLIRQVGFCRMQSFDTVSRSTSESVPMFLDGRILMGVGLSNENMKSSDAFLCGACLRVTHVENFYEWNSELTQWGGMIPGSPPPFLVMVMDQCTDPVCTRDFLDFDIYHEHQPVMNGNPYHVEWTLVPCPVKEEEPMEYILCTATTCHADDEAQNLTVGDVISTPVEYWSLTIRNTRMPLTQVLVEYQGTFIPLRLENAWVWDQGPYSLKDGIDLHLYQQDHPQILNEVLEMPSLDTPTSIGYRGGIRFVGAVGGDEDHKVKL